jgi:hypothetical protein
MTGDDGSQCIRVNTVKSSIKSVDSDEMHIKTLYSLYNYIAWLFSINDLLLSLN